MLPLVSPSIESIVPYEAGKPIEEVARELGVRDAIKLASNENPFGPSPKAIAAVRGALEDAHRYPDASAHALRQRLSEVHDVPMADIIQGNGSNELIELLVRTFARPTEANAVVFAEPSFVVYRLACLAHGVGFSAVPLREFRHDLPAMKEAVSNDTRLLFVANPNNPTGTHVTEKEVEKLLREVPPHVIVVMDEAYFEYADSPNYPNSLNLRSLRERLVVLRTFSKVYGLASFRVGYAVGPAELIGYMNRVRAPFNVGTLSQLAALAAIDDKEHVERSCRLNSEQRLHLEAKLQELGLKVVPSQTNFVFVEAPRPGREIYQQLLRQGVIVRPLGQTQFLRITVGTSEENTRLLAALTEVLAA